MKKHNLLKPLALALGCATLLLTIHSTRAADIRVNAGTTFDLLPTSNPGVFTHTVDGVVQNSLMGNCTIHADVIVRFPANPTQLPTAKGSLTFTAADGVTTLKANVDGTAAPDPVNPAFLNFSYQVTFTGGSGPFASARGDAAADGVALFTSQSAGKATWTLKGVVLGINQGKSRTTQR